MSIPTARFAAMGSRHTRRFLHARSGPERYLAYGELDVDLARDAAPILAFGNAASHDFFSTGTGCQTFGTYGMDLAGLCIRHTAASAPGPK